MSSRLISNKLDLITGLAEQQYSRGIEMAGGFLCPENPNRELRRRMQREDKRQAKLMAKKNNKEILDNS